MKSTYFFALTLLAAGVVQAQENPLTKLIGVWEGDKGVDVAPAQKSTGLPAGAPATSPYFEKMVITDGAGATNAGAQDLVSVKYHLEVFRKADQQKFHDQIGYWIWDAKNKMIIHSFCVPRGVCATAEGKFENPDEFNVKTTGPFAENEFMKKNGKTTKFSMTMKINPDGTMTYTQQTDLKIYGKKFAHVDLDTLTRKAQ